MEQSRILERLDGWALVLGASSGFGEAASLAFAREGMNVAGVHLDRRSTMANVERIQADIKALGREALFFNVNAADEKNRNEVLDQLKEKLAGSPCQSGGATHGRVRVLLHSLAFGTLKPFVAATVEDEASQRQVEMTLDVMGNSLIYWTQGVLRRELMGEGGRIFAMTSTGSWAVWRSYGIVGAAKAALEAYIRQLAFELAPRKITANAICAGVTDTPALRKIPGNDEMIEVAKRKNPHGRLTTPEDVAAAMALLAQPASAWITGNVINVDGGEAISGG
jgi:NAD(P)-dependent dehydrogenase (short-subunit alcohol dehydrogenase family)